MEYKLTFQEAIEKIFKEGGYIQGENFASGVYAVNDNDLIVLKDANNMHTKIMNFMITKATIDQYYKYLSVATSKTLSK